jgi:ABC-2 type transport system permease protein
MEDAFIAIVEEARSASATNHADSTLAAAEPESIWLVPMPAKARRVWSLVRKESRQIVRDSSSIAIGIVLPVLLILLFGYGLSLDVTDSPVAVVLEDISPESTELAAAFQLSPSFQARLMTSMPMAERLMLARKVDAIIRIRPDFGRQVKQGSAEVQILVHGTDANRARILQGYAQGAIAHWTAERAIEAQSVVLGPVTVRDRLWFNEANESRYFLVPGLIVLIMTLIGALLTALVMAREWERGTLEALFVTPVRVGEILLGKTIPYFLLGLVGLALCIITARYLFHVPLRGSLVVLIGASMLYLLVALGIGLLISSAAKNQFFASQITILATFLPAVMMSGFLFDLRSMPAAVRAISYILPARYFVALLQTVFLAGNVWNVISLNGLVLAGMAALLLAAARLETRKQLT